MIRRTPVLVLVAGLIAAPLVLSASAVTPSDYPTPGCFTLYDATGDAGDDDLDLYGAALRTTGTSLQAFISVKNLGFAPKAADGHRFTFTFSFNNHRFAASGSAFAHNAGAVRDTAARSGLTGSSTQLTVDEGLGQGNRPSGLQATFDTARSFVVLDLPIADIVRYGQAGFGGLLSQIEVTSASDNYVVSTVADSTNPQSGQPSRSLYAVGDNRCFGPNAAVLTLLSGISAQYGDLVQVSARLQDSGGSPLAQRPVTVSLGGARTTATTASDGVVRATLDPQLQAGSYPLTVSFAGDATAGAVTAVRSFSVVAERTVLTLKNVKQRSDRFVQATLKDDDGRPIVGATITWTVGGAPAGSAVTSSRGTAELHGLTTGVAVQASYAGASGMYLASTATTRTTGHDDD